MKDLQQTSLYTEFDLQSWKRLFSPTFLHGIGGGILICLCYTLGRKELLFSGATWLGIPLAKLSFEQIHFIEMLWWLASIYLCYLVLPCLIIVFIWKKPLASFGFQKGKFPSRNLSLLVIAFLMLLAFVCSFTNSFQQFYPLYGIRSTKDITIYFWIIEALYLLQFVAIEFFYRGYLLLPFKTELKEFAILLPLLPYVMIHIQKPFPEMMAAFAAGLFLGFLSYRKQSIWFGVFLHGVMAMAMDFFSVIQKIT